MKKILVLIAVLGFSSVVKADETFTVVSMSNLVAAVKAEAKTAMTSSDDTKYRAVAAKIKMFSRAVEMEESLPTDKTAITNTLTQLNKILQQVAERFDEVIAANESRLEMVIANKETGTAYGLDLVETRNMMIPTLRGYLVEYGKLKKEMAALQASLKEQVKQST